MTPNEKKTYDFILNNLFKKGKAPTLQEIANHLDAPGHSRQLAAMYVDRLVKMGYMERGRGWRNLKLLKIEEQL